MLTYPMEALEQQALNHGIFVHRIRFMPWLEIEYAAFTYLADPTNTANQSSQISAFNSILIFAFVNLAYSRTTHNH